MGITEKASSLNSMTGGTAISVAFGLALTKTSSSLRLLGLMHVTRKVPIIRDYGSFFQDNPYNPGLPITLHNPILTRMPTSSSTVFLAYPFFDSFLSVDTLCTGTLPTVPPHITTQ